MTEKETGKQGESINASATAQFMDGDKHKIIKGRIIEDQTTYIVIECEHARYRLNKNVVEWIKYER